MKSLMIGQRVLCLTGYRDNKTSQWIHVKAAGIILDSSPEKTEYLIRIDEKYWEIIKLNSNPENIEFNGRVKNIPWCNIIDLIDEL